MQDDTENNEVPSAPDGLATVQCIISHPQKPKFLAIKHSTGGYLPPQVKVPQGASLGPHVHRLIDGIQSKYGLRTTLLRRLARYRDYQCVELEVHAGSRPMQAVWVGMDDYRRIRGGDILPEDPLARWLQERQRGEPPPLRPPWERYGWFKAASNWIHFQLDRLDRLSTGAIEQRRTLSHAGCLLRTPCAGGAVWFKAAYAKPPSEAALSRWLASRWPEFVPEPLVIDEARNWILMPDYAIGATPSPGPEGWARAAATLGRMQVESLPLLDELRQLGCVHHGLDALWEFLTHPELASSVPEAGRASLSDAEREALAPAAGRLAASCRELADCGIPDLLVHPDFRASNLFVYPDRVRILDWENACIAPPMFSLLKLLREDHPAGRDAPDGDPVVEAWMAPLQALAKASRLRRALHLARRLEPGWRLMRWSQEFAWFEPGSVAEENARRFVVRLCRELLATESAG